jgi:hypothetical protein
MTTVKLHNIPANYHTPAPSFLAQFITWTKSQEKNRLLWLGIILAAHGCILTPMTVMSILLVGAGNLSLVILAIIAMGMALVSNLAAQPTKVTIPVFLLSVLIDLAIFAISVFQNVL